MKVTEEHLQQALMNILHDRSYMDFHGLANAVKLAAEHCWINQLPENEDTRVIRAQLVALRNRGHLDLISDYKEE